MNKGVLVSNWDAALAEMTVEEKVFADKYGSVFMHCRTKAQEDRDQQQEAPELKLIQAVAPSASSGAKPAGTVAPVNPNQMDDRPIDKRKAEEGGIVEERNTKKPPATKKESGDEAMDAD